MPAEDTLNPGAMSRTVEPVTTQDAGVSDTIMVRFWIIILPLK